MAPHARVIDSFRGRADAIAMNNKEKIAVLVGFIAAMPGFWSAYNVYHASAFKHPFDEHSEIAKSYIAQITSAERRRDISEIARIRLSYERYEESWRAARQIARMVAPIENLAIVQLAPSEVDSLRSLLSQVSAGLNQPSLSPKTLGAAYLAIGDYRNAVAQLTVASKKRPDQNTLALKSAAFSGLAYETVDPANRLRYEANAVATFNSAESVGLRSSDLSAFAIANPGLKAILDNRGTIQPPRFEVENR